MAYHPVSLATKQQQGHIHGIVCILEKNEKENKKKHEEIKNEEIQAKRKTKNGANIHAVEAQVEYREQGRRLLGRSVV